MNYGIRPEDILADEESNTKINGVMIRKGSIAAFLKNIDVFEDIYANDQHKSEAIKLLKELAKAVVAVGLHKHANFKNPVVQSILDKEFNYSSEK